jgi:DNA polymerase III subunit alpha
MHKFTHLHLHTQYSILDGACKISKLISLAQKDGMEAVAITDHGVMYGVKDFYNAATKAKLKPIIGCEMYVANRSRFDKDKQDKNDRSGYHLILLAKNKQGYKNLSKLASLAAIEGFYYKPRIDRELLEKYHEGLICSTACIGGQLPQAILNNDKDATKEFITYYKNLFGDDFYFELMRHKTGDPTVDNDIYNRQVIVNKELLKLAAEYNVKVIATNDVHFLKAEDAKAHDILICLNTGSELDDADRMHYTHQEYFKTQEEMNLLFEDVPEAIINTQEIVDKIEAFKLESDPIMPHFPIPSEFENADAFLKHLTYKGAEKRYGTVTEDITKRIDYELEVIQRMGFPDYFLIVRDFLQAAREKKVAVGPGRGSAAGSVVAYCNQITDIDPIKYNLLFERFLNPDRISMPDIDIDFDDDGREQVIKYVVEKYGQNKVAQIITFGSMAPKLAIRDTARVLKMELNDAMRLTKLIPEKPGTSFEDAFKEVKELEELKNSGSELERYTLKYAVELEGSIRQVGTHACGIIIGRDDLTEFLPMCKVKDSSLMVTQYEGSHVESVGMLKMDFLGLKTLSIIRDALDLIKESKNVEIDIETIPLDDALTYELYSKGETTGLFQFESPGMKKHLRDLKPNRFEDLIAMNALYRPGPMEYIPSFIKRKHGEEKISYAYPVMEKFLSETYGITVYQEQVMLLSQAMAGFTGGQADSLRKAMGKKQKAVMDSLKEKFMEGCKLNGFEEEKILKIWSDWEAFAEYAFNKSHSTCYAYVSYQTGYLKAHYPAEFMAAVLSRNLSDIKKISFFMDECRRMGIKVLGPDVNESNLNFSITKDGNIRFGMAAIKGIGEKAVQEIIQERKANGFYKDIYDFVERVNIQTVNKKNFEALVYAGALDNMSSYKRYQFFATDEKNNITFIEQLARYGNIFQSNKNNQQVSLFGDAESKTIVKPVPATAEEWTSLYMLDKEKETIGIYLSAHPLDDYRFEINAFTNTPLSRLVEFESLEGKDITFAGMITEARRATDKRNNPFGILTLEDYTDSFKIMLFSEDYKNFNFYLNKDWIIFVKGKFQQKKWVKDRKELEFKVTDMMLMNDVREKLLKSITVKIPLPKLSDELITDIVSFSQDKAGKVLLKIIVWDPEEKMHITMYSRDKRIDINNEFITYLEENPELSYKVN